MLQLLLLLYLLSQKLSGGRPRLPPDPPGRSVLGKSISLLSPDDSWRGVVEKTRLVAEL